MSDRTLNTAKRFRQSDDFDSLDKVPYRGDPAGKSKLSIAPPSGVARLVAIGIIIETPA